MTNTATHLQAYRHFIAIPREQAQGVKVGDITWITFQGEHPRKMIVGAIEGKQTIIRIYLRPVP